MEMDIRHRNHCRNPRIFSHNDQYCFIHGQHPHYSIWYRDEPRWYTDSPSRIYERSNTRKGVESREAGYLPNNHWDMNRHSVRRNYNNAPRYYYRTCGDFDSELNGQEQRALSHRQHSDFRAKTGAPEDGWLTVDYRRRRSPHPNRRITEHQCRLSKNICNPGNFNQFSWLDIEDDSLILTQAHVSENLLPNCSFGYQKIREENNRNWKRTSNARITVSRDGRHRRQGNIKDGHLNCRPKVSLPAATPATAADTLAASSDAAPQSTTRGSVEPQTTQSQSNQHNHVDSSGKQPKTLTWADILKKNNDHSLPNLVVPFSAANICLTEDNDNLNTTQENRAESDLISEECEKFGFFGEDGFDSIKIESKLFKFAVKNKEIVIFEIKKSLMHKISFNLDLATQIIGYISQITRSDHNYGQRRRIGHIMISTELNNSGWFLKISKEKGSFILIPTGPKNSRLLEFLAMFSNTVGISALVQEDQMHVKPKTTADTIEPTSISKLIFNFQIQGAYTEQQQTHCSEIPPKLPLLLAYSDASDSYDPSDESFFSDDFLGHATESERRLPISNQNDIRDSKFNRGICHKSKFITSDNCLPTDNLNTQLKIYKKSQKNKRRHSMRTRSQSKQFPWA
ncbi:unnamed protein product [Cuscuta epithymum]|uniref:Uncharacterized protein n=1 Tax=Cuscuta epithymum TaxID=186058 RepID=A0AAV0ELB2_9ASTE|nr:unnamed protein product [Cuscuta epithymum]